MGNNYYMESITLGDIATENKIVIPSYQRGLVWKHKHKKDFIETLKLGDPIGVVLVYKENEKYTLIDGLQRLSTIKAYMNNPLAFIDEKDTYINEQAIEEIIKEKSRLSGEAIPSGSFLVKKKKEFKKELLQIMDGDEFPADGDALKALFQKLEYPENMELVVKFLDFYKKFCNSLKLSDDIKIPAIVYNGDKNNLPTVFQKLNTGSVALTKYEVFASIWPPKKQIFNDEEIVEKVINKYDALKSSSNFDVELTENDIRVGGITFFEYCYALSEILCDENNDYSFLFRNGKKCNDIAGFELLALVCGLNVNNSQWLADSQYLGGASAEFLVALKNAIIDSVSVVSESLKKWVFDYRGNNLSNDSVYQIYHMITSVFKNQYELNLKQKVVCKKTTKEATKWRDSFKKYAFKSYLLDVISDYWGKNRQVADLKRELEDEDSISRYRFNIDGGNFKKIIGEYLEETMKKSTAENADNTTKLLLSCFYKMKEAYKEETYFKSAEEISSGDVLFTFDIEHIVPKEYFRKFGDKKFPKSHMANLCYLSIKDNRSKRDLTLYEYCKMHPAFDLKSKYISFISYPSESALHFINQGYDDFKDNYIAFLEERSEIIAEEMTQMIASI